VWRRAHYEAGAWILYALPESWQDAVLDRLRGSDDTAEQSPANES